MVQKTTETREGFGANPNTADRGDEACVCVCVCVYVCLCVRFERLHKVGRGAGRG